jgi:signal transduction histidine kinase
LVADNKDLLRPDTELISYRILQESLTNIGKYAQASRASVSLTKKDHQVCLSAEDMGRGFGVERIRACRGRKRGLGLASMEERPCILRGYFSDWKHPGPGRQNPGNGALELMAPGQGA